VPAISGRGGKFTAADSKACKAICGRRGISFLGELARGRATAWSALGDSQRAVSFAEEAVRLRPERSQDWLELANLYDRAQRFEDAKRARARAAALIRAQEPPNGQRQER
jgi:tetratricopeptide (TPR) repeat protein